jgi:hypothetical protein
MITKKVAVPLINEKILQQAVHCYIATSSISLAGFEFIRSRIPPKTKIDIVTSLDAPTSPLVLDRILKHYQGRINLNIYTRNVLHANLFVFDLPFRKSVAFVGSGSLSLEGLKDHEELFWKITDPKEVESVMSWYTSYFQFSQPLTQKLALGYESLYKEIRQREILSRHEKELLIASSMASFNWDSNRFRFQYFSREDFDVFSFSNVGYDNAALRTSRMKVLEKLREVLSTIGDKLAKLHLKMSESASSLDPLDHPARKIWALSQFLVSSGSKNAGFEVGITLLNVFVRLTVSPPSLTNLAEQEDFQTRVGQMMMELKDCTVEVAGDRRSLGSFQTVALLQEHLRREDSAMFPIVIEKAITPGEPSLNQELIGETILDALQKLEQVRKIIGV